MSPISPYNLTQNQKKKEKQKKQADIQEDNFLRKTTQGFDRHKNKDMLMDQDGEIDDSGEIEEFYVNKDGEIKNKGINSRSKNSSFGRVPESPFLKCNGVDSDIFTSISNLPANANLEPESPFLPEDNIFSNNLRRKGSERNNPLTPGMNQKNRPRFKSKRLAS